jgi:hypothetical protein
MFGLGVQELVILAALAFLALLMLGGLAALVYFLTRGGGGKE